MNDDQLQLYLQQIISDVHAGIAKTNLTKPEQVEKLKGEIQKQLKRFDVAVDQIVPPIIADEFFGGIDGATKALVDEAIDAGTGLALGAGGVISEEFRQPVYLDALDEIMNDTFGDLRAARRTAEMSALDTIDDTIANVKGEIAKGTIKGDPRKVMQEEVMTKFREGGLTSFITEPDINGIRRRLPLDFYAMLVTRTKMRDAGVTGATKRYTEAGQDLVKITERADTCLICGRFRGMVVSLTGETEGFPAVGENGISLPPYHPNCRGTISVYVLKRKTPEEIEEIKAHNAKYNQTDDRRTERQRKGYNNEQAKRRVANAEKKQFMAWNDELGADNYKTLGAFRRAKKTNSPKFQELGSQFRSAKAGKRLPNGSKAAARAEAAAKREAERLAAAKAAKAAKAKAKREAAKAEAAAKAKAEAKAAAEAERRAQGKAAVERMRAAAAAKAKTPPPAAAAKAAAKPTIGSPDLQNIAAKVSSPGDMSAAFGADYKARAEFGKLISESSGTYDERMEKVFNALTGKLSAKQEIVKKGGITDNALKRFKEVTKTKAPLDMSSAASIKKYGNELLENAGLGHVKTSVKKINANGQVTYYRRFDGPGNTVADVTGFTLNSADLRGDHYKAKTLFHEFYHANYHKMPLDTDLRIPLKVASSWEETATEAAAHFMARESGIKEMILPAYTKDMMTNLPRLKQLDEFKDCIDIEDFGAVFMKYRFDDDFKSGKWEWLNDAAKVTKHDVFDYNSKHYYALINENIDEVVEEIAAAINKDMRNDPRHHSILKQHIKDGMTNSKHTTGYDLAIGWAMKKAGIK